MIISANSCTLALVKATRTRESVSSADHPLEADANQRFEAKSPLNGLPLSQKRIPLARRLATTVHLGGLVSGDGPDSLTLPAFFCKVQSLERHATEGAQKELAVLFHCALAREKMSSSPANWQFAKTPEWKTITEAIVKCPSDIVKKEVANTLQAYVNEMTPTMALAESNGLGPQVALAKPLIQSIETDISNILRSVGRPHLSDSASSLTEKG